MMPAVHLAQAHRGHVRVDLGGGDLGVPEQRLHDAQVGAARQEVRRERMAEHVREDARAETRGERTPPDDLPDRLARQGAAAAADEDEGARPPAKLAAARRAEVRLERFPRRQRRPGATESTSRRRYFSGIAGSRFNVWFAGSIVIPTDSRAVTPRSGSAASGPKMTRPAVTSPMNSSRASVKAYS